MKFKVGDRVKVVRAGYGCHPDTLGEKAIITKLPTLRAYEIKTIGKWRTPPSEPWEESFKLIERGKPMSKYQDLKERIERVTAWDREADDILQEMKDRDGKYYLCISVHNDQLGFRRMVEIQDNGRTQVVEFGYKTQCEKLQAFKRALLWLLDLSDIKKDIVGTTQKVKIEGKVYNAEIVEEL